MSNVEQLPAVKAAPLIAGGTVKPIVPQSMEDAYRIAVAVCKAGMAPSGMGTPDRCLIAIMQGLEVGMTPMQSLQRIAVINGRPTIWGDGALALVRGSGLCEFVSETLEGDGENMVARCAAKRRGEPTAIQRAFSVDDAKLAGLWGKNVWKQYPKRMLQMRARAFALRDLFADVLGGMYLAEELQGTGNDAKDITPPPPPGHQPPPPVEKPSALKEQLKQSVALEAQKAADGLGDIPPELDRRPKPKTAKGKVIEHEPTTGEIIEDEIFDPDKFLDDLDAEMSACKSQSILDEVMEQRAGTIASDLMPPDRDKAVAIYNRHTDRLTKK